MEGMEGIIVPRSSRRFRVGVMYTSHRGRQLSGPLEPFWPVISSNEDLS